jgi:hypothetical protein
MSRNSAAPHAQPARALLLSVIAALALLPAPAHAQALDASRWVTDGDVNAIVPWGNTVYVGGSFGYVGPNTGGWTEVDAAGHATTLLPRLDGEVTAMIGDGAGGWFIAGPFTHVAGVARPGLAHVTATGTLTAWSPSPAPTGVATALEHAASRVFVATSDNELKAYDDATGAVVAGWAPAVTGMVVSMAVNGTTLYAGGDITFQITGTATSGSGIAAIHTGTGGIAAWDPAPDAPVTKIQLDGRWLYVTGSFTSIGGESHSGLARALVATQAFDPGWNPSVDQPVAGMATAQSGFWIVGGFFLVGGEFRNHIAVLDTTSGATKALAPDLNAFSSDVTGILVNGSNAYVALAPSLAFHLGGSARPLVVLVRTTDGTVDKFYRVLGDAAPTDVGALVHCMRLSPHGLVIAGRLITAGGRSQVAIAALDRATGLPRNWDPGLAVDEPFPTVPMVNAILPTNHGIYIGGYFTHAGGALRKSLAAVDSVNAIARPFQADLGPVLSTAAGTAFSLALYQNRLMVGGDFNTVSGAAHTGLAQVDTATGAPVAGWTCDVNGAVNCMLVRGTTVFVGGGLAAVGGQSRSNIGALNGSTAAVLAWNPNVAGVAVDVLAAQNDTLYIGGDYSQVSAQSPCLPRGRVLRPRARCSAGRRQAFGPVRAMVIDGPSLIVGGEFAFLAGQPQAYLGRLDRFTGTLGTGTPVADDLVLSLARTGSWLHIGGRFGKLGGSPTANLGRVGGAGRRRPRRARGRGERRRDLGGRLGLSLRVHGQRPSGVASVDVELSRAGTGGPWTLLAAGLRNTGHFEWTVTGPNVRGERVPARHRARLRRQRRERPQQRRVLDRRRRGGRGSHVGPGPLVSFAMGPNPARLETSLRFTLRQPMRAGFRLLDVQGREVWSSPEQPYEAGDHVVGCPLGRCGRGSTSCGSSTGRGGADPTRGGPLSHNAVALIRLQDS